MAELNRRDLLLGAACLGATAFCPWMARSEAPKTRVILLGTAGGPRPRPDRSAPAQVVLSNGAAYVIDCGDGVARQLVRAGVALPSLRHIFVTHHHSDHDADYGNLIWLAWASGLRTPVDAWGPPPLRRMTELFFEMNASDIETRIADEGRPPLAPLVHVHELREGGAILRNDDMKISAALVHHPPVTPAFGYRFDGRDRSIVISGDTTPTDELVQLAKGADVLIHEAYYAPAVERLVAKVPNAPTLRQSIVSHHTTAEDAGRIAREAGVGLLVLSHLVPADDPAVTDEMWIEAARKQFRGRVVVGRDLLEV